MYGYGFLLGIVLVLIFWFLFVAPMERQMHKRSTELMRRKLERNEVRLRQLRKNGQTGKRMTVKCQRTPKLLLVENQRFTTD